MSRTVLEVQNISKQYKLGLINSKTLRQAITNFFTNKAVKNNIFWALKGINFKVEKGEVLGVIGHNGAGKSTLLKVLSQITSPTEGKIKIQGRIASLLEVGTGFHNELTGRENIYMNGAILGMNKKEIDTLFDKIVAFSEVEKFLDTPVKKYSSGMKVRLGFSVAAHLNAEILLIDEVLSVGDESFQRKCLQKMDDITNSGRTILFVSHNLTAVENLCDRCLLLEKGKIVKDGLPKDVINYYHLQNESTNSSSEIHKRIGDTKVTVDQISVEAQKTDQPEIIKIGDAIKIKFSLKLIKVETGLANISIKIWIKNQFNQYIFTCDSDLSIGEIAIPFNEPTAFCCTTDKLNIIDGQYNVDIRIKVGSDVLKFRDALKFEVTEWDFFGNGKSIPEVEIGRGLLAVKSNWQVNKTKLNVDSQ